MSGFTFDWAWQARQQALQARAAIGWGEASRLLAARLRRLDRALQSRLTVTAHRDVLIAIGETTDLPWIEGVSYAGPSEVAAELWLPTLQAPSVPLDLLSRILQRQYQRTPLLLWPAPMAVIPLDRQLPLTPVQLDRFAARWNGH